MFAALFYKCVLCLLTCVEDFPCGSKDKESASNTGDLGSVPGSGRSPGEENSNPLQYSCLENSVDERILAGYSPRGDKETDLTERLRTHTQHDQ